MAGRGPAPAAPGQRRRRNQPERGDWITLPSKLSKKVLPALPKRTAHEGPWSARTKAAWEAWRQDPATSMFGPGEIQDAIDLAFEYENWVRDGASGRAREIRQRKDDLGLTLKGKQERRWRIAEPDEQPAADTSADPADVVPLRIVRGQG